jgi:ankyrin repeat protein
MEIVEVLLSNGAAVNTPGGRYGGALQAASFKGHEEIVEVLLENEADINTLGPYGTALHAATREGQFNIIKILLERGVNTSLTDSDDHSALCIASNEGDFSIVKLLIEGGADVNQTGFNLRNNPLYVAKTQEIKDFLVEKGAVYEREGVIEETGHVSMDDFLIQGLLLENGAVQTNEEQETQEVEKSN